MFIVRIYQENSVLTVVYGFCNVMSSIKTTLSNLQIRTVERLYYAKILYLMKDTCTINNSKRCANMRTEVHLPVRDHGFTSIVGFSPTIAPLYGSILCL